MKRFALLLILAGAPLAAQTRNVSLAWTDTKNPAATTYNVYRSNGACPGATFGKLNAAPVAAKSYVDSGVAAGRYCYFVTAEKDGLESDPSGTAQADAKPFAPDAPTILVEIAMTARPDGSLHAAVRVNGKQVADAQ